MSETEQQFQQALRDVERKLREESEADDCDADDAADMREERFR